MKTPRKSVKYPGIPCALDGSSAVIMCEREASDAAGAYPITPSTQMGEYWAEAAADGHLNAAGRPLIFIQPEGEHAAAGVTAGLAMTGLRATNFSSGQGIAYMHESLYAAAGKRLTYVLNMGCRAITKATLNVHAGHDDYHAVDDTGFFQVFGRGAQEVCDLNLIAHKVAELALTPGIVAQDGFLTTHVIESIRLPERELIAEFLGAPEDMIDSPTPAQRIIYGEKRRRVPELWNVDDPMTSGSVQNQESYMQSVAAQRPFFYDHIQSFIDEAMAEYEELTGRHYSRVGTYRTEDADYLIIGQGSAITTAQAVADYLRSTRNLKVGVVDLVLFRPFPGDLLSRLLGGRKGITVLERTDQPLAEDLPLIREVRATLSKAIENGAASNGSLPYPDYGSISARKLSPLYSGCYGLGSRDLQPEAIIGAVENMLPKAPRRKFFYLSIDFIHEKAYSPKQEAYQEKVQEAYPGIKDLAVHGSENPNLMPEDCVTVRMHSVGGWGAITTGKNLALTLFDLFGLHIKANPKYGSEKKGQPTTYYLAAASEPIRTNCEYLNVDVVLSPDPNVFSHSNPLSGLREGGVFIIQSTMDSPQKVWESLPARFQSIIIKNKIRVFYLDAFKIARSEASDPGLQFRMQGNAFQGAFFRTAPLMESAGISESSMFQAIEDQLTAKFGSKGARVVEDNLRVVRRGYEEVTEIVDMAISDDAPTELRRDPGVPVLLKGKAGSEHATSDIHRFWEQTGSFYKTGQGGDNLSDPFAGVSLMPAATGIFRDMTQIRVEHPVWIPGNCTGCGNCYAVCPDSAIPGLVHSVAEIFETAVRSIEEKGAPVKQLRRTLHSVESKLRTSMDAAGEEANVRVLLRDAITLTILDEEDPLIRGELEREFVQFQEVIGDFQFAVTKPYYTTVEKETKGSGGLMSITVNPYACKGCMECVEVCDDNALEPVPQTEESVAGLRRDWKFWELLPTTSPERIRIDDLDEQIGALETLLLDKSNYNAMVGGDGACPGCGEKTVIHIFTAVVAALMRPRVKQHISFLTDLIAHLEKHVRLKLLDSTDLGDTEAIGHAIDDANGKDLTLSRLFTALDQDHGSNSIDPEWLRWVSGILAKLKHLKWQYTSGITSNGRSDMGMINATGCSSVWGSTYPYTPYPFPWASHLFQDAPSVAMGVFEGHMLKMAQGFKAIRMAELELKDGYNADRDADFFAHFDWHQFSNEEFLLCPPVVAVGGDGAMYDIGFQNLSRMMMSEKPIKVLVLDTQVYSNTGGQACTSGFTGQISDMAQYGKAHQGKEEIRKEIGLVGMAHRTTYIAQGAISNMTHLIESFITGVNARRPALFNIYSPCPPEHGITDDVGSRQSKMAVESRAYPLFRYDPGEGDTPSECFDLEGNPARDEPWPTYTLEYSTESGGVEKLELPFTFADFALTESRFKKQFRKAPRDTWTEDMVPLAEYVLLDSEESEDVFPFIWAVDNENHLIRVIPSEPVVQATRERMSFWKTLCELANVRAPADTTELRDAVRSELVQQIANGLQELVIQGADDALAELLRNGHTAALAEPKTEPVSNGPAVQEANAQPEAEVVAPTSQPGSNGFVAAWIDSAECTSCDECTNLNGKIFAYNEKKLAYIKDPKGGPYKDIVRAAEKCTAKVIHPGYPQDRSVKGVDRLVKRAEKFM